MFSRLFRRDRRGDGIANALYGAIVAQARQPAFYAELGVPDSLEGRFEMLLLHLTLVSRRLMRKEDGEARAAGQAAFDLFCADMDGSLRELGVGDLSVPRRMREMGEAFFGRSAAYEAALSAASLEAMTDAIRRNVWPEGEGGQASAIAAYAMALVANLDAQPDAAILANGPTFPDITAFVGEGVGS